MASPSNYDNRGEPMNLAKILSIAAALAAAGSAQAAGVGIRAGTTGLGADLGWNLAPTLDARVGYSALNVGTHVNSGDVRYDSKLKLSNLSALADWKALGPFFRLTGGFILNDNKYNMTGEPSGGTYRINGHTYNASDVGSLNGDVKAGRRIAPYLGIGGGNVAGAGVNFYWDLGIMFMGSPKARLNANCGPTLTPSQCAQLQSDVASAERSLEDDLKRLKYYPVANIGITIGF
jgi:hypothetical protein